MLLSSGEEHKRNDNRTFVQSIEGEPTAEDVFIDALRYGMFPLFSVEKEDWLLLKKVEVSNIPVEVAREDAISDCSSVVGNPNKSSNATLTALF